MFVGRHPKLSYQYHLPNRYYDDEDVVGSIGKLRSRYRRNMVFNNKLQTDEGGKNETVTEFVEKALGQIESFYFIGITEEMDASM